MKHLKHFESDSWDKFQDKPLWHENISKLSSVFVSGHQESIGIGYLVDKSLDDVIVNNSKTEVAFHLSNGEIMIFYHEQDCCENFVLEDVDGDFYDIINTKILLAEERISTDSDGINNAINYNDSNTWTFYTIRTLRGTITMRFCGSSNGYYSERCDICLIKKTPQNN
jgi:hypothetical protein